MPKRGATRQPARIAVRRFSRFTCVVAPTTRTISANMTNQVAATMQTSILAKQTLSMKAIAEGAVQRSMCKMDNALGLWRLPEMSVEPNAVLSEE